jgi:hypothetical protein
MSGLRFNESDMDGPSKFAGGEVEKHVAGPSSQYPMNMQGRVWGRVSLCSGPLG